MARLAREGSLGQQRVSRAITTFLKLAGPSSLRMGESIAIILEVRPMKLRQEGRMLRVFQQKFSVDSKYLVDSLKKLQVGFPLAGEDFRDFGFC